MHTTIYRSAVAGLAMTISIAAASTAFARVVTFSALLTCGAEVPPNPCKGRGTVSGSLDTDSKKLTWTASFSGLTGNVIGAHFHGPVLYVGNTSEQNAPIQVGTPGTLSSPFKGSTTITDTQAKDLLDGRWYFNIHTPTYPAGEIRGHIIR
jgi:CHRD domain